jgi:hypothetical protein
MSEREMLERVFLRAQAQNVITFSGLLLVVLF